MQTIIDIVQGGTPCITTLFPDGKKRKYQLGILTSATTYSITLNGLPIPNYVPNSTVKNYQYVSYIDYYLIDTTFYQKHIIKHLFALADNSLLEMKSEIYD